MRREMLTHCRSARVSRWSCSLPDCGSSRAKLQVAFLSRLRPEMKTIVILKRLLSEGGS